MNHDIVSMGFYTNKRWTEEQLQEVLYQGDNTTFPVIEYPPPNDIVNDSLNIVNDSLIIAVDNTITTNTPYSSSSSSTEHELLIANTLLQLPPSASYIVEFYSPWCPHCQHYKPYYIRLARQVTRRTLVSTDTLIYFIAVSCTLHSNLCTYYGIEGFPTLMAWGPHVASVGHQHEWINTSLPGLILDSNSITPEYIADVLGIELTPSSSSSSNKNIQKKKDTSVDDDDDGKVMDDYYYEENTSPSPKEASHLAKKAALDKVHSFQYLIPMTPFNGTTRTDGHYQTPHSDVSFDDLWIQTKNHRYHDIAMSIIFLLQNALTLHIPSSIPRTTISNNVSSHMTTTDSTIQQQRMTTFIDFLLLLDWTLPPTWHIRTGLIQDLLSQVDTIYPWVGTRHENETNPYVGWIESWIQILQNHSYASSINVYNVSRIPWGFISPTPTSMAYNISTTSLSMWSSMCTHIYEHASSFDTSSYTYNTTSNATGNHSPRRRYTSRTTGYTCGLWELFHTITIGASLPQQQLYGHLMGYKTSSYHVALTIKQVIQYFFGCDVCRKNFVTMYDTCGYNHCTRFKPSTLPSFIETHPSTIRKFQHLQIDHPTVEGKDLVLWLWEVHNAVNIRIMSENAQREKRVVSTEETLAGKFPTKVMCPSCWKDSHMQRVNHDQVYTFLKQLYWPGFYLPVTNGKIWLHALEELPQDVSTSSRVHVGEQPHWTNRADEGGEPISSLGLVFVCLPFILIGAILARKLLSTQSFMFLSWIHRRKGDKRS